MAVGLAACGSSDAQSATLPNPGKLPNLDVPPVGPIANPAQGINLFTQSDLNFETLFALGASGYGVAEVGEVIATTNQINAAGASYDTYYDNFVATAQRVGQLAESELKVGRVASARSAYLRSASYYDAALFFVLGTSAPNREVQTYRAMQTQWNVASQLFNPAFERVAIPYQGTTMPGYFMTPDNSGKARPTVIINNGSDAQFIDIFVYGGAAALERGFNALLFEGPGQGSMLFERLIPVRPDWQHVITPVVDYLSSRSDVDSSKIALTGWSMGGELVLQAAAFEHRLAAVVSDPGTLDLWPMWSPRFRDLFPPGSDAATTNSIWQQEAIPTLTAFDAFTVKKRSELMDPQFMLQARAGKVPSNGWLLAQKVQAFNATNVVSKITSPTMVTNYQLDTWFSQADSAAVYSALHSEKKFVEFTVEDGAEYHCAPMAPQKRNQVVFDWLEEVLHV